MVSCSCVQICHLYCVALFDICLLCVQWGTYHLSRDIMVGVTIHPVVDGH
jgi:hypothetical protein